MLWLLEAGHTPQHLSLNLSSGAALEQAIALEVEVLQSQGKTTLATALAEHTPSASQEAVVSGLEAYGQANVLQARLQRLNQDRGPQQAAAAGSSQELLAVVVSLLNENKVNTAVHQLCSHAERHAYSPQIEQALAEAAEAEQNWLGALAHWQNILHNTTGTAAAIAAQTKIAALESSSALMHQRVGMQFDHLLFEEAFLTHPQAIDPAFASSEAAAVAFWQHDARAEALLSPEINPQLWADFRGDSSLQEAGRFWLVQKLFHGRCLLEAIGNAGGVPIEAMTRRCASSFDATYYLSQKKRWKGVTADTALAHYLHKGWTQGLDPSRLFSTEAYLEQEPLLTKYGINPLYFAQITTEQGDQKRVREAAISQLGHGTLLGRRPQQIKGNMSVSRFMQSRYFNPKFTWFTASPPGDHSSLELHVVIPDFGPGGGGHMTIFRMVNYLERQGHRLTVWVLDPDRSRHAADLRDDVLKHFQPIQAKVLPLDASFFFSSGDAVIATGWQTVESVCEAKGFKERFYFVQDYEPFFYPRGTDAVLAEATYSRGLACICASPWLNQLMAERFRAWSRPLWLAYDQRIYHCNSDQLQTRCEKQKSSDHVFHLAVYARRFTERRCVELAFASLERLVQHRPNVVVHLFGDPRPPESLDLPAIHHGVLNADQLANLYSFCDLGITLSATNYSLLPQEMMASGLPVVDLAVESTEAIYPSEVITLVQPSPEGLAHTIDGLLNAPERMLQQTMAALDWVRQFSWDGAGQTFEHALVERLGELDGSTSRDGIAFVQAKSDAVATPRFKASVVIPTHNAGAILKPVLAALQSQQTPWDFQCLLIDSASSDGTVEQLERFAASQPHTRVHQIQQDEFQHGHTRNRGVAWSDAEFVAFLTQDAIPADEQWLYNLVSALDAQPNAAGAFGRHIAHDGASHLIREELKRHFQGLDRFPKALTLNSNQERICSDDQGWRQVLHFYSDNNSCLRKSVWQQIPLPCVPFGEDQLWAEAIIRQGYAKVYAKDAVVKHSHHYSAIETFERSKTEAEFFHSCFGHTMHHTRLAMDAAISGDCKQASAVASQAFQHCHFDDLNHQYISSIAKHVGWRDANQGSSNAAAKL